MTTLPDVVGSRGGRGGGGGGGVVGVGGSSGGGGGGGGDGGGCGGGGGGGGGGRSSSSSRRRRQHVDQYPDKLHHSIHTSIFPVSAICCLCLQEGLARLGLSGGCLLWDH